MCAQEKSEFWEKKMEVEVQQKQEYAGHQILTVTVPRSPYFLLPISQRFTHIAKVPYVLSVY
tara:strand:+ start:749 stop:934 length:186 start_codon:yes stop_codon:yes gene_type:complete